MHESHAGIRWWIGEKNRHWIERKIWATIKLKRKQEMSLFYKLSMLYIQKIFWTSEEAEHFSGEET